MVRCRYRARSTAGRDDARYVQRMLRKDDRRACGTTGRCRVITAQDRERARLARLKSQMRDRELRKFANPDRCADFAKTWVVYVWAAVDPDSPIAGEWMYAGVRRKRNRRKLQSMNQFFAKVRRQFELHCKAPVMLMDLNHAANVAGQSDQSWRARPPQFQVRKVKMPQCMPEIDRTRYRTRAKVQAYKMSKAKTKFIAIGRNAWERTNGYLYLGPLDAQDKSHANHEAKRKFPLYNDLLILPVESLSVTLYGAIIRGRRVRAGCTRFEWPEVPPTFSGMWAKFVRRLAAHDYIPTCDERLTIIHDALMSEWAAQNFPRLSVGWFRKQVRVHFTEKAPKCATLQKRTARKSTIARRTKTKSVAQR